VIDNLLPHPVDEGPPVPRFMPKWPWVHNPGNPLPEGVSKEEAIEIIAATPWAERAARGMARLGGLRQAPLSMRPLLLITAVP